MVGPYLLAIDPGTRELGWALFEDGHLDTCGVLRAGGLAPMVYEVEARFGSIMVDELVVETPQAYGLGAKVDPNDLLVLSILVGVCVGVVGAPTWSLPRPREWKGQTPKDIMQRRAAAVLGPREREAVAEGFRATPKSLRHNGWDAVEIGLWKSKRI